MSGSAARSTAEMVETLLDEQLQDLSVPSARARCADFSTQHASGRQDNHKILFSLVVLEQWLRANESPVRGVELMPFTRVCRR